MAFGVFSTPLSLSWSVGLACEEDGISRSPSVWGIFLLDITRRGLKSIPADIQGDIAAAAEGVHPMLTSLSMGLCRGAHQGTDLVGGITWQEKRVLRKCNLVHSMALQV